jgi:hypothetical protein
MATGHVGRARRPSRGRQGPASRRDAGVGRGRDRAHRQTSPLEFIPRWPYAVSQWGVEPAEPRRRAAPGGPQELVCGWMPR